MSTRFVTSEKQSIVVTAGDFNVWYPLEGLDVTIGGWPGTVLVWVRASAFITVAGTFFFMTLEIDGVIDLSQRTVAYCEGKDTPGASVFFRVVLGPGDHRIRAMFTTTTVKTVTFYEWTRTMLLVRTGGAA